MTVACLPWTHESAVTVIRPVRERNVTQCVQQVLRSPRAEHMLSERRRERRHPYPYPVRLSPVSEEGMGEVAETIVVLGKHLSNHGLDFYYYEPIPYRRAIACFDCGQGVQLRLLMDLTWCRFCQHGWYENGGRFLEPVTP